MWRLELSDLWHVARGYLGKSKMNALGHCMKEALALVWSVWRGGYDFTPEPPPQA